MSDEPQPKRAVPIRTSSWSDSGKGQHTSPRGPKVRWYAIRLLPALAALVAVVVFVLLGPPVAAFEAGMLLVILTFMPFTMVAAYRVGFWAGRHETMDAFFEADTEVEFNAYLARAVIVNPGPWEGHINFVGVIKASEGDQG